MSTRAEGNSSAAVLCALPPPLSLQLETLHCAPCYYSLSQWIGNATFSCWQP